MDKAEEKKTFGSGKKGIDEDMCRNKTIDFDEITTKLLIISSTVHLHLSQSTLVVLTRRRLHMKDTQQLKEWSLKSVYNGAYQYLLQCN